MKENNQKQEGNDNDDKVLTILTPPKMGHGDLTESPARGQEDGEDDWRVPVNITSSAANDRWVEGTTGYGGATTLHEGGEEYV